MLVIGDSSFPGQVSLGILHRFPSVLLSWALLFLSFSLFLSFLPKPLRDIGNASSLPLSVPHPILYAPSQNFHSRAHSPTKKGHNGNALSCWILKMFLKNPLKNNFKPKHYIFIRETSENTDRYKEICKE